jgi:hypothetical protein
MIPQAAPRRPAVFNWSAVSSDEARVAEAHLLLSCPSDAPCASEAGDSELDRKPRRARRRLDIVDGAYAYQREAIINDAPAPVHPAGAVISRAMVAGNETGAAAPLQRQSWRQ